MRKVGSLLIPFLVLAGSLAQDASTPAAAPPAVYVAKGACPFECCTYREWWTTGPVTVVDKPGGTQAVATLAKGEHVQALTGEVHVKPLRVVATKEYKEPLIPKGEVFWLLDPEGEGVFRIWLRGKTADLDSLDVSDPSFFQRVVVHQRSIEWWAQVRTKSGVTGWTKQTKLFANQDRCGG